MNAVIFNINIIHYSHDQIRLQHRHIWIWIGKSHYATIASSQFQPIKFQKKKIKFKKIDKFQLHAVPMLLSDSFNSNLFLSTGIKWSKGIHLCFVISTRQDTIFICLFIPVRYIDFQLLCSTFHFIFIPLNMSQEAIGWCTFIYLSHKLSSSVNMMPLQKHSFQWVQHDHRKFECKSLLIHCCELYVTAKWFLECL